MIILKSLDDYERVIIIQNQYYKSQDNTDNSQYNIIGLVKRLSQTENNILEDEKYNIILEDDLPYTNNELLQIKVVLERKENNSNYNCKINNTSYSLTEEENLIQYKLEEGNNIIKIDIEKNDSVIYSTEIQKAYIHEYQKQFLDEFNNNAISTHFDYKFDDDRTIDLLKYLGIKMIRDDISWNNIENEDGKYNFEKYDKLITKLNENNIELVAIMNNPGNLLGEDKKISNEDEMLSYVNFVTTFAKRYTMVTKYEILNEQNFKYATKEEMKYYIEAIKMIKSELMKINNDIEIWIGGTAAVLYDEEDKLSSVSFIKYILEENLDINNISIHQYDNTNNTYWIKQELNLHQKMLNELGGFNKINVSEYGASTYINGLSEEGQASKILKQSIAYEQYNVSNKVIYNSKNIGNVVSAIEQNYGIINYDYTPKLAYYALKNYYENTNGAEYIGTVDLVEGIEAHVYNKDGRPKIIMWSNTNNVTITIPYLDFSASDMYGSIIDNKSGELEINNTPVYLDNISNKYFYEAISNTTLNKYEEFEEKFATELSSIDGIIEKIEELKQYMISIKNKETETQDIAVKKMSEHFALGNTILNAYKNSKLDVEYVKISSMLDMLNDIGNSYEDLVTVSATIREPYFTATDELMQKVENTISNNTDLEIIYPSKILDFSKELDEKAEYINSLEEKNDIKTGLIVSNSLHAYYLADWANEFSQIYVEDYVKANTVTVSYSNTDEFTNQDVVATLNIGSDSKVTNNEGKNTYTFTQNGEFTFEYTRRGQAYTIDAKVSNIDKEAPEITDIEAGKIYMESATPVIEDENLYSIDILLNGKKIETYENGMKLTKEGIYAITATDKAGNVSKIEFYIIEDTVDGYVINNSYIMNVRQKTTLKQFKEQFNLNTDYSIINNKTILSNDSIVATGDVLQLESGKQYTIVVAGDINGDGRVANYDLSALRRYILRIRDFNEIESLAADINIDGQVLGVKDYSRMRIEILGRY